MAVSQELLVRALDYVTQRPGIQLESLTPARSSHFRRINDLFENKNLVAVGIGRKETVGVARGELALCFYVKKKLPPSRVPGSALIPPVISMPNDQAVFTDVKEIGEIRPELQARATPLQSGYSISHAAISGTGTLGAIVKKDGKYCVLSNSHVLAKNGLASIGDAVVYPGTLDGGRRKTHLVARLAAFVPFDASGRFVNRIDAALAEIDPALHATLDLSIHGASAPFKTGQAKRDMVVVKSGRTTGETRGTVVDVNFRFVMPYAGVGDVAFVDQVYCTRYTDAGDSGAIVVEADTGKIVGLHFAGSPEASVFSPIDMVTADLGFEFVSKTP